MHENKQNTISSAAALKNINGGTMLSGRFAIVSLCVMLTMGCSWYSNPPETSTSTNNAYAVFDGTDQSGKNLDGQYAHSSFKNANLQGSTLSSQFADANFSGGDLRGATLDGQFADANFSGADLRGATLDGQFAGANFAGADLRGVDLSNATHIDTTGAILTDADLPTSRSGEAEISENIDQIDQDIRALEDSDATDITNDVEDTFDAIDQIDCSISENFGLPECY